MTSVKSNLCLKRLSSTMANVPPLWDLWWQNAPSWQMPSNMLSKGVMGMFGTDWAIRKYNHVDGSINYVKILQYLTTFLTGNCEFQVFWVYEFFRLEVYLGLSTGGPLSLHGNCVISFTIECMRINKFKLPYTCINYKPLCTFLKDLK